MCSTGGKKIYDNSNSNLCYSPFVWFVLSLILLCVIPVIPVRLLCCIVLRMSLYLKCTIVHCSGITRVLLFALRLGYNLSCIQSPLRFLLNPGSSIFLPTAYTDATTQVYH